MAVTEANPDRAFWEDEAHHRRIRIFAHACMISSLVLQKFGLTFGNGKIFISLPVALLAVVWLWMNRSAKIRGSVVAMFCLVAVACMISALFALNFPDERSSISLLSLISLLANYFVFLFRPTHQRADNQDVLRIFLFYARLLAVVGIVQYLAQFSGIRIFSFSRSFPFLSPILVEKGFNSYPVIAYGSSIVRSTSLCVEAAYLSQLLAVAIAIEFFVFRSFRWLPLYGLAYLFSFSGTGLLCLGIAVVILGLSSRVEAPRILGFAAIGLVGVIALSLAFPAQFASITQRSTEFQREGTSGSRRLFGQVEAVSQIAGDTRSLVGLGPGAMDRATFLVEGTGTPAMKLFIDSGWLGLTLFVLFIIGATMKRGMGIIPILMLVEFQFGGGNLLFSPLLVQMALLCIWASPPMWETARARQQGLTRIARLGSA
jgi:hypothetical protein